MVLIQFVWFNSRFSSFPFTFLNSGPGPENRIGHDRSDRWLHGEYHAVADAYLVSWLENCGLVGWLPKPRQYHVTAERYLQCNKHCKKTGEKKIMWLQKYQ